MSSAIGVEGLSKRYGADRVLQDLSFSVERGEIFALLGVNGAGKTTTLECIEGLRRYEEGRVTVKGSMGIQLQSASLPAHIKPLEALELFARWKGTRVDVAARSALGVDEFTKKRYLELSTGQKRRLHLALALTGDPDILFLDEPTAGLDVEGRLALHGQIRALRDRGKTIILSSHDMAEVESLCDRIAILNRGRLAFLGTVQELSGRVGKRYTIRVKHTGGEESLEASNISDTLLELLGRYKQEGIEVTDIEVRRGSLEEHFIEIAKGAEG